MAHQRSAGKSIGTIWRIIMWGTILILLLIPAAAMQLTSEVDWTASDFVFAAVLMGSVGLGVELTVRASGNWAYRGGMFIAMVLAFLTIWANGAVGIIGDEENPLNLLYFGLLLGGGLAGALTRMRARPLSWIVTAVAVGQFVIAAIAAANGYWIWIAALVLGGAWSSSAVLFARAAGDTDHQI